MVEVDTRVKLGVARCCVIVVASGMIGLPVSQYFACWSVFQTIFVNKIPGFSQLACQCINRYFQAVYTGKHTMHLRLDKLYIFKENFLVPSMILMHWTLLDRVRKAGFVPTLRKGKFEIL